MENISQEIAQIEITLTDTTLYEEGNKDHLQPLLIEQSRLSNRRSELEEEWLALQESLEEMQNSH